jgi:hypothetical protein
VVPGHVHFDNTPARNRLDGTRGAAAAARTPHPEFDRHHAPLPLAALVKNAAAMPILRSADCRTITTQKFVTQED